MMDIEVGQYWSPVRMVRLQHNVALSNNLGLGSNILLFGTRTYIGRVFVFCMDAHEQILLAILERDKETGTEILDEQL
jgi:hypothetical protein